MLRFVLRLLLVAVAGAALGGHQPLCEEDERVQLPDSEENSIHAHGLTFEENTFWRQDGKVFGCPCKIKPCLRLCTADGKYKFKL